MYYRDVTAALSRTMLDKTPRSYVTKWEKMIIMMTQLMSLSFVLLLGVDLTHLSARLTFHSHSDPQDESK